MIRIGTTDVSPEIVAPTLHSMKVCACQDGPVGVGATETFPCGKRGRYLVVMLEKTEASLTLCEVEVYEGRIAEVHHTLSNGHITQFTKIPTSKPQVAADKSYNL